MKKFLFATVARSLYRHRPSRLLPLVRQTRRSFAHPKGRASTSKNGDIGSSFGARTKSLGTLLLCSSKLKRSTTMMVEEDNSVRALRTARINPRPDNNECNAGLLSSAG